MDTLKEIIKSGITKEYKLRMHDIDCRDWYEDISGRLFYVSYAFLDKGDKNLHSCNQETGLTISIDFDELLGLKLDRRKPFNDVRSRMLIHYNIVNNNKDLPIIAPTSFVVKSSECRKTIILDEISF